MPSNLVPEHYNIELRPHFYDPDPANFLLEGNTTITLRVVEATSTVLVHYRTLVIEQEDVTVRYQDNGQEVPLKELEKDPVQEIYRFYLQSELEAGRTIVVFIHYTAPLTAKPRVGIYYSTYYEDDELKYMLATQFEPIDARKAYPCLDEPGLKAKFNVTMWSQSPMTALTNMPVYETETE